MVEEFFNVALGKAGIPKPVPLDHGPWQPLGECSFCDRERAANNRFFPPHTASKNCKSGHHTHCTCDTCF